MFRIITNSIFLCITIFNISFSQESDTKVYKSSDSNYEVVAPGSWSEIILHEDATIQIGNTAEELYLMVLPDNKVDLSGWNLQKHSYVTLGTLVSNLSDPIISEPEIIKISENEAIQYIVKGTIDGLNIVYLHTTIESSTAYNQILAWTLFSKFENNKKYLESVIFSFVENDTN